MEIDGPSSDREDPLIGYSGASLFLRTFSDSSTISKPASQESSESIHSYLKSMVSTPRSSVLNFISLEFLCLMFALGKIIRKKKHWNFGLSVLCWFSEAGFYLFLFQKNCLHFALFLDIFSFSLLRSLCDSIFFWPSVWFLRKLREKKGNWYSGLIINLFCFSSGFCFLNSEICIILLSSDFGFWYYFLFACII